MNPPSEAAEPLTRRQREAMAAELTWLEESAAAIEGRTGQRDTYYHNRAAAIRAALEEMTDGKLD